MSGPFKAHETLYHCRTCRKVYRSKDLRNIVARYCNVAWDVLVFVGKSLYHRCLTTDEVCLELMLKNIDLSPSEVEYLGRKFILYLALAHQQATPRIEQAMNRSGGYILHLDATHEGDAPVLMTGMDGLKQIVLGNVKIPSEHTDHIVPFLEQLQRNYGPPIACVHDMGTGICKAVSLVFPGTRDFVCHFHFLRDAGKDLLEPSYGQLRKTLQKHAATTRLGEIIRDLHQRIDNHALDAEHLTAAITEGHTLETMDQTSSASIYSLCLWCLQGKKEGNGYGFPFDRPLLAFARRIAQLKDSLPSIQKKVPRDKVGERLFGKLNNLAKNICNDPDFIRSIDDLEWRTLLFDDLRRKMRIADPSGRNGLNDDGSNKSMNSIQKAVGRFRSRLDKNTKYKRDLLCQKLAKQIDKYDERLFADPIEVDTPSGKITIYPQRTNNLLEQFFRGLRRDHRRKTGNNSMRRILHAMLADTPLIKNLGNPEYMHLLLNGKKNLEELFADLEIDGYEPISSISHTDRVLPGFRKMIIMDNLPEKIQLALEKCS
ncbi:transposase [uncultured Desulfobacter sp.]|uniref:transposase n=1 Tax=uncultured Desulfobacter sp. TaxID=240139 RepID=UPI002AAC0551|nr:transposase [uncultured Desulfobacter sp.]